jgi:transposase InsO family protein
MCRVLEVSKAGYYAWRSREASARERKDLQLAEQIVVSFEQSRGAYGSPRVHADLRANGLRCGRKRVARLMRERELRGATRRRFRRTSIAAYEETVSGNILNRQFHVRELNRVWVSDFTHIPTREGALYLAVVLDLCSRRVVGWSMQTSPDRELVLSALDMALAGRRPPKGLLFHNDRGTQYTCRPFQVTLREAGITSSMSRKGNCWDNAVVESFFASLKRELVDVTAWKTREDARADIFAYIETWYNRRRRHSSLGYLSPEEFESTVTAAA